MEKIGIDVGGVILEYDLNFALGQTDEAKFMENSLETINELSKKYELYIVSYCTEKTEIKVKSILADSKIAIPEKNWIFTRTRQEKADVCLKYSISQLIDDTHQIHQALLDKCPLVKRIWFNPDLKKNPHHKHIVANNWNEVKKLLL